MRKAIVRKRSDIKPSAEFVGYVGSLHRAIHAIGLFFDRTSEGEISQAEAMVLLHLSANPASTINDVHRAFLHRRSTLTSVLDRLEGRGVLERSISKDDRRNLTLKLTQRGRQLAAQVLETLADLEGALKVPNADYASAWGLLERTAETASELPGD
jgi:DNA-binding MarR family transcriptional regulator